MGITTKFGAKSTAEEVAGDVDLSGKRAVVTGGASGIGVETARTLARHGASVTLAVRDTDRGGKVAEQIGHGVRVRPLELTDHRSITAFADGWDGPLHLLINNAGVMALPSMTPDPQGWEFQFATNHLGHFALTTRLHAALAAAGGARVVSLSSSAHLFSPVVFDDINFKFRPYDATLAYAQSKTAVNLFAVAATGRWHNDGITVNAANPGAIATPLQRHVGGKLATPIDLQKTTEQGASTTVLLAVSPLLEGIGGRYFNDNQQAVPTGERPAAVEDLVRSVAPYSLDPDNAERLWTLSAAAVGTRS